MSIKKRATRKVVRRAASFGIVSALVLAACGSQPSATPITPSGPLLVVNPSDGTLFKAKGIDLFKSNDGGQSWERLTRGLPQGPTVKLGVLRHALCTDTLDPCGVYFGTTGGQVYTSTDSGDSWEAIVSNLPKVMSVEAQAI